MKLGKALKKSFASGLIGLAGLVNSGCTYEQNQRFDSGMTNLMEGSVAGAVASGVVKQRAVETNSPGAYEAADYLQRRSIAQEGRSQNFVQNNHNYPLQVPNTGYSAERTMAVPAGPGARKINTGHGEITFLACNWYDLNNDNIPQLSEIQDIGRNSFDSNKNISFLVEDTRWSWAEQRSLQTMGSTRISHEAGVIYILDENGNKIFEERFDSRGAIFSAKEDFKDLNSGKYTTISNFKYGDEEIALKIDFEVLSKN